VRRHARRQSHRAEIQKHNDILKDSRTISLLQETLAHYSSTENSRKNTYGESMASELNREGEVVMNKALCASFTGPRPDSCDDEIPEK
jgi:hypothetical protein